MKPAKMIVEQKNKIKIPWVIPVKTLIWSKETRKWCGLKYPNHPKGCPNWKTRCPERGPYVDSLLDLKKPMWIVHSEFDLAGHVEKMRGRHPKWTERQLRNVLYWQSQSRKQLRTRVAIAIRLLIPRINYVLPGAEYSGVNVYVTALKSGLKLERIKDLKTCRHIAILGTRKGRTEHKYLGG